MVQLEEVEDQDLNQAQPGPIKDEDYDSADFVDTDSELSDEDEDDGVPAETFTERLSALKDILPPPIRRQISSTTSTLYNAGKSTASWGGKGLWVLSTGAMMLMVPFAMAFVEEQTILEQEREMKAREGLGDAVTPGVSAQGMGFGAGQGAGGGGAL